MAHRADRPLALFEVAARDGECVTVLMRLAQECGGLRTLVRDRCAFGIVFVIGRGQL